MAKVYAYRIYWGFSGTFPCEFHGYSTKGHSDYMFMQRFVDSLNLLGLHRFYLYHSYISINDLFSFEELKLIDANIANGEYLLQFLCK